MISSAEFILGKKTTVTGRQLMAMEDSTARLKKLIQRLNGRSQKLKRKSNQFSHMRLSIFCVGISLSFLAWWILNPYWSILIAFATLVLFLYVINIHEKIDRAKERLRLWSLIKERQLASLELDWDLLPEPNWSNNKNHPFALDLDIVGPRSILHLIDLTSSITGSNYLKEWFINVPSFQVVLDRQRAVQVLVNKGRFRDKLTLYGLEASKGETRWDHSIISKWVQEPSLSFSRKKWLFFTLSVSLINILLVVINIFGGPLLWPYTMLVYSVMFWTLASRMSSRIEFIIKFSQALLVFTRMMAWLEEELKQIGSESKVLRLAATNLSSINSHTKEIKKVSILIDFSQNEYLRAFIDLFFPLDLVIVLLFDRTHRKLATSVPTWINTYGQIEALNTLATYAELRSSECVFPVLNVSKDNSFLEGESVSHPLLPAKTRIGNDINIRKGMVSIITGSNMSGKSTYIRAIGIACVMAWAGGVVCAKRFETSSLRVYSSMRVNDMLQDGKSTFYAEVERLARTMEAVREPDSFPVLVLLDEILRGTNTKERLIGVKSIIQALANNASVITLIATHDLEVAQMAKDSESITNYHFKEKLSGKELLFDYKLNTGFSDTTNALIIIQNAGLPINPEL